MDKKAKKRLDLINQRIQTLRQKLAGAKQQPDEPGEVERLQAEIKQLQEEAERLKAS